jgi:hypothetical protein
LGQGKKRRNAKRRGHKKAQEKTEKSLNELFFFFFSPFFFLFFFFFFFSCFFRSAPSCSPSLPPLLAQLFFAVSSAQNECPQCRRRLLFLHHFQFLNLWQRNAQINEQVSTSLSLAVWMSPSHLFRPQFHAFSSSSFTSFLNCELSA